MNLHHLTQLLNQAAVMRDKGDKAAADQLLAIVQDGINDIRRQLFIDMHPSGVGKEVKYDA